MLNFTTKNRLCLSNQEHPFLLFVSKKEYSNCSVPSQLRCEIHSKSPSVMAFCLVCLGILAKNMPKHLADTTFWTVTNFQHLLLLTSLYTSTFIICFALLIANMNSFIWRFFRYILFLFCFLEIILIVQSKK